MKILKDYIVENYGMHTLDLDEFHAIVFWKHDFSKYFISFHIFHIFPFHYSFQVLYSWDSILMILINISIYKVLHIKPNILLANKLLSL